MWGQSTESPAGLSAGGKSALDERNNFLCWQFAFLILSIQQLVRSMSKQTLTHLEAINHAVHTTFEWWTSDWDLGICCQSSPWAGFRQFSGSRKHPQAMGLLWICVL